MKLEQLLHDFAYRKGLPNFSLNKEGLCHLHIDDKFIIAFEKSLDEKGFYLYGTVGVIPHKREKEIALKALSGNLFGQKTGKASLGYDAMTHTLVLFEYFEEEFTDAINFQERVNQFLDYLAYWVEHYILDEQMVHGG